MVYYKTKEEIELLRESSLLVSGTLAQLAEVIKPGLKTIKLDQLAEEYILDHGAVPAFKNYKGFPYTLCISINEEIVHGMPSDYEMKEGDVVSVDCGVKMNGYYGDSAYTFLLEGVREEVVELAKVTKESLYLGIEKAVVGNRLGDIGFAIQQHTEKVHGYGVVRDLVGHGIGKNLHEAPEVPNYGKRGKGQLLKEGLVLAIEPMINLGTSKVLQLSDGWTIITRDKTPSVHFEHDVAITKEKPDILSDFRVIEQAEKNNNQLHNQELKALHNING